MDFKPIDINVNLFKEPSPPPSKMRVEQVIDEDDYFDLCFMKTAESPDWKLGWAVIHRPTGSIVKQGYSSKSDTKRKVIERTRKALRKDLNKLGYSLGQLMIDGNDREPNHHALTGERQSPDNQ